MLGINVICMKGYILDDTFIPMSFDTNVIIEVTNAGLPRGDLTRRITGFRPRK